MQRFNNSFLQLHQTNQCKMLDTIAIEAVNGAKVTLQWFVDHLAVVVMFD